MTGDPDFSNPAPQPLHPPEEGTGLPRHVAAGLACVFLFFGGIVFLFLEKRDRFVRFYSWQSILLGALWFVFGLAVEFVLWFLGKIPFIGWIGVKVILFLNFFVSLVLLTAWVMAAVKAFRGKEWNIPYLGPYARRYSAGPRTIID